MFSVSVLEKWKGKIILNEYVFYNKEELNQFIKLCRDSNHFIIRIKNKYNICA